MRYPLPEAGDDPNIYGIVFRSKEYRPEADVEGRFDLQAEALENSREYRELIFRQLLEESTLAGQHAEERLRFLAQRRRDRRLRRVTP